MPRATDDEEAPMLGVGLASGKGKKNSSSTVSLTSLNKTVKKSASTPRLDPAAPAIGRSASTKRLAGSAHASGAPSRNESHDNLELEAVPVDDVEVGMGMDGATMAVSAAPAMPQEDVLPSTRKSCMPLLWKYLMYVFVIGPWKFVRGLGWLLNRWQRVFRPISTSLFHTMDSLDKHMPTVASMVIWSWNTVSLILHFVSVLLTFGTIRILYTHNHRIYALVVAGLYGLSHYLMAVVMYMEVDRISGRQRYNASEAYNFIRRLFHVGMWDVQLFASLIHSNFMIEGLTQMLLKGYEEARVCVHVLVNTIPACVMLGVLYDGVITWNFFDDINIRDFRQQISAALVFSVLNAFEKWMRFSIADPWMHPRNDDRYPLLYMRSNAARLPRGLMLDWLFRCNVQLTRNDDVLKAQEVFAVYTFNCKGKVRELCDGHKAYLVQKALRTFNGGIKYNKAEVLARRLDKSKLRNARTIRVLDLSGIHPGRYMSGILSEVLADCSGFEELIMTDDYLGDDDVMHIMEGLRNNRMLEMHTLDLSRNEIGQTGCEAVAAFIVSTHHLQSLSLKGNPLRDAGIKALSEVLLANNMLHRLDLSDSAIGSDAGALLGHMLKSNRGLKELVLRNTKLGNSGVESLSRGLKSNATLKDLDISRTGAEDKAAVGLAQALATNRSLTRLSLAHTRVGDAGAKALCDALQNNDVLQICDLSGTQVDRSWIKLMSNILSSKRS